MKALLAIAIIAGLTAASPVFPPEGTMDDLDWMAGRWERVDGDRWTEEFWSAPRGGMLIGYSRSGTGEALREFEYLRIEPGADGVLVYSASPGGRPAVPFRLFARTHTTVTFANRSHDFPQLISYRREGDRLTATISALDGSNAMHWVYRRRR